MAVPTEPKGIAIKLHTIRTSVVLTTLAAVTPTGCGGSASPTQSSGGGTSASTSSTPQAKSATSGRSAKSSSSATTATQTKTSAPVKAMDSHSFCDFLLTKTKGAKALAEAAILDNDKAKAKQLKELNREMAEAAPPEIHDAFVKVLTVSDALLDYVITGKMPDISEGGILADPGIMAAVDEEKAWLTKKCPKALSLLHDLE